MNDPLVYEAMLGALEQEPLPDKIRYLVGQVELAPSTNRKHFQGYVELASPCRIAWLKTNLGEGHYETRRGTRDQARDYCMKTDTRFDGPFEFGVWNSKGQGKRTDLESAIDTLRTTGSLDKMREQHPVAYVKYHRGLERLHGCKKPTRAEPPEVILLYGGAGRGKTRYFHDNEKEEDQFDLAVGTSQWFDGYEGQEAVLIDDFDGKMSKWGLTQFLRLIDRYVVKVPVKGSFVWWCPKRIYVSTNYHPRKWWNFGGRAEQWPALVRRFTKVCDFVEAEQPPIIYDRDPDNMLLVEDFFGDYIEGTSSDQ